MSLATTPAIFVSAANAAEYGSAQTPPRPAPGVRAYSAYCRTAAAGIAGARCPPSFDSEGLLALPR
jgi:hypothetical protein